MEYDLEEISHRFQNLRNRATQFRLGLGELVAPASALLAELDGIEAEIKEATASEAG